MDNFSLSKIIFNSKCSKETLLSILMFLMYTGYIAAFDLFTPNTTNLKPLNPSSLKVGLTNPSYLGSALHVAFSDPEDETY